jgi:hypothetical protein
MDLFGCNRFDPAHSILVKETNMHKGFDSSALKIAVGLVLFTGLAIGSHHLIGAQKASAQTQKKAASSSGFDAEVRNNSERMMKEGQQTFRFDPFGSEPFVTIFLNGHIPQFFSFCRSHASTVFVGSTASLSTCSLMIFPDLSIRKVARLAVSIGAPWISNF